MPTTTTKDRTDDPIRAEVERVLHAIVEATIAAPVNALTAARRCVVRRVSAVGDRLAQPARLVRSLFDLAAGPPPRPAPVAPAAAARAHPPHAETPTSGTPGTRDPVELPIEEYESLAASQVVARLPTLTPGELREIRRFEARHRGRRTVLGKIDQLLAPT